MNFNTEYAVENLTFSVKMIETVDLIHTVTSQDIILSPNMKKTNKSEPFRDGFFCSYTLWLPFPQNMIFHFICTLNLCPSKFMC